MRKVLAVSLLDIRRLGFGLVSAALVAGLIPSLASGIGGEAPAKTILILVFIVVGAACGGYFGNDFTDGRSSFFFARPLPTWALITGRLCGFLAIAAASFTAFMTSYWLSSRGRAGFTPWILNRQHGEALFIGWSISLYLALAIAVHSRTQQGARKWRDLATIPLRLGLSLIALVLTFGLFSDLIVRAYFDPAPLKLVFASIFAAFFVASCVAIGAGRTERLRIMRFLNLVMATHAAILFVVIVAAWTYVLHPGSEAITGVRDPTWGSSDGRSSFVHTAVNRGDSRRFSPVFVLDIASGQARLLNADPYLGPWTSADGLTVAWSEATPLFFRPLWRFLGGATNFRVRTGTGDVQVLPMPAKLPERFKDLADSFGVVRDILPSPDGDLFAVFWDRHLTFMSRSRGEVSDVDLGPRQTIQGEVFLPSGVLRLAVLRQDAAGASRLEFSDVDPKSGELKPLTSIAVGTLARLQIDPNASRALLTSGNRQGGGASITLMNLTAPSGAPISLVTDRAFPSAVFLADGRIAVAAGGSVGAFEKRILKILSPEGQLVLDVPIGDGTPPRLGGEMFPGVVAVRFARFTDEVALVDTKTGATLRSIPRVFPPMSFGTPPPPGTPAARLLQSADGKLYELPSITAEPRLLLPLPKS